MSNNIDVIGREREVSTLKDIWNSKEAEFVAVYGRRRAGKTFLISQYFQDKDIYFELTGIKDGSMQQQLQNFADAFSNSFFNGIGIARPTSWRNAFKMLHKQIMNVPDNKRVTIFLDEIPWLATKRSRFLQSLDYFWNTAFSRIPNVKLIVCGSAASWMLDNLVNAKGGLYNRLTKTILLKPYNLHQTKQFLQARKAKFTDQQILNFYMVMGGIPHYLKQIDPKKSVAQNISRICFTTDGLLFNEFPRLFQSLFDKSEIHFEIVRQIAKYRRGVARNDLLKAMKMKSGGLFNKCINELEAAGFTQSYTPYGKRIRQKYYRIIDEYSTFYLRWIEPFVQNPDVPPQANYWQLAEKMPAWHSWSGYAFEAVCYKHVHQISTALNLDQTVWYAGSWQYIPKDKQSGDGAQIDLLFDREDGVITLCEIKFNNKVFKIDKDYAKKLISKMDIFERHFKTNKQITLAFVTNTGVHDNAWSEELVDNTTTITELFIK